MRRESGTVTPPAPMRTAFITACLSNMAVRNSYCAVRRSCLPPASPNNSPCSRRLHTLSARPGLPGSTSPCSYPARFRARRYKVLQPPPASSVQPEARPFVLCAEASLDEHMPALSPDRSEHGEDRGEGLMRDVQRHVSWRSSRRHFSFSPGFPRHSRQHLTGRAGDATGCPLRSRALPCCPFPPDQVRGASPGPKPGPKGGRIEKNS